jgi:hypothetical protein
VSADADHIACANVDAWCGQRGETMKCRKCKRREVDPVDSTRLRALARELDNFFGREGESESDRLRRQSRLGEVQAWLVITADRADGICPFCGDKTGKER